MMSVQNLGASWSRLPVCLSARAHPLKVAHVAQAGL